MENFKESGERYSMKDTVREDERWFLMHKQKAVASNGREGSSTSTESGSRRLAKQMEIKCKRVPRAQDQEVEQLHRRLQFLEEEIKTTKKAFFRIARERRASMNEVCEQFKTLRRGPQRSRDTIPMIGSHRDEKFRTGLSQILSHESNPSLVFRDFRANAIRYRE